MNRTPLAALLASAVAAALAPGAAALDCYGLDALRVCAEVTPGMPSVDPDGGPTVGECVYLGDSCTPVSVTLPTVILNGGGGVYVTCYRYEQRCW